MSLHCITIVFSWMIFSLAVRCRHACLPGHLRNPIHVGFMCPIAARSHTICHGCGRLGHTTRRLLSVLPDYQALTSGSLFLCARYPAPMRNGCRHLHVGQCRQPWTLFITTVHPIEYNLSLVRSDGSKRQSRPSQNDCSRCSHQAGARWLRFHCADMSIQHPHQYRIWYRDRSTSTWPA